MPTFNSYTSVAEFIADNSVNIEMASLIGGNSSLSGAVTLGAVSLPLVSVTGFPATGSFNAYLLDGPNSEVVTASVSGANLSVPAGTAAGHAAGVNVVSGGLAGNLAEIVARASAMMEELCGQGPDGGDKGLYTLARTEILQGPNQYRAAFDRDGSLRLRPYHFPVQSVATVNVQFLSAPAVAMNLTYLVIPDGGRVVHVPTPQQITTVNAPPLFYAPWPRSRAFYVTMAYTGGPAGSGALSGVPYTLREACHFLMLDRLAFRSNNLGMINMRRGDVSFMHAAHSRQTTGGESLFLMQAKEKLSRYVRDQW